MRKPLSMHKHDTIALIAPSSGLAVIFPKRLEAAVHNIEQLGFRVKVYPTLSKMHNGSAGTPEERVADIHAAFTDPEVKAIVCAIGGSTCNEILPLIDYKLLAQHPKIFCGYSDITLLHAAIAKNSSLVTFYGPSALVQFGESPHPLQYTVDSFLHATSGKPLGAIAPSAAWTDEVQDWSNPQADARGLRKHEGYTWIARGAATGQLVGGCLPSLHQMKGTPYDWEYQNKILLLETCEGEDFRKGQPLSVVSSLITDLRLAGVFDSIAGLVIGVPYGYSTEERAAFMALLREQFGHTRYPVLANVNTGHTDPMLTLPLCVRVRLDSEKNEFVVEEAGTVNK